MNENNSLYSNEQLLRLIVQASPSGMVIVNQSGEIQLINRQALEWFGYNEGDLLGRTVNILLPHAHRELHSAHMARYMARPETRPMAAGRNLFGCRADGSEFPIDISLHPLETEQGIMILANIVDATDRRRAEQEAEMRHAMERLALLGQLAAGVAHEIRTPLCVIRNDVYYLQTMSERLGPDGEECIDEINQSVAKANRIVSELLDFTRDPLSNPEPVLLGLIVRDAQGDYAIPSTVELRLPLQNIEGIYVLADREQISRVLINLFRNAVQAMNAIGKIEVTVTEEAHVVHVDVCDDGPGVSRERREAVFEPLFTTKPKGIGLGLAVSRRYARRNQGDLTLLDVARPGACFRLTLPKSCESVSNSQDLKSK